MALDLYRRKRDFEKTSEPPGRDSGPAGWSYLIQKHAARRLHYDFRLEMDGVLKSWAVTRGPSLVAGERRLAVHVEDHPLDYGSFEGTIPKGQYGGGTVLLWDRGSWTPLGDPHQGYAKGHLEFELHGEKLRGRWHLVRMRGGDQEKRDNWLLIKADDEAARPAEAGDILEERQESVKSGRDLAGIGMGAPGKAAAAVEKPKAAAKPAKPPAAAARTAPMPDFVEPALASLVSKAPKGKRWIHEIKFDGYRLQSRIDRGQVRLLTRSGLDWTRRFGERLVAAFQALPVENALIDGELVVENDVGATSFSSLQEDLSEGRADRFVFYAFDLLHRDGQDLRAAPLTARKQALQDLLGKAAGPLRYSEHFGEDGDMLLRHACRLSLEGLVSKLRDAPYRSGRSKDWVKSKCSDRQEFVIGGYLVSTTSAKAIGSLVLGLFDKGELHHVGRVGTGFSSRLAADLFRRLEPLEQSKSPFAERLAPDAARGVHFVAPTTVAEIEFRGWTADRNLRHAAFRGLREDKPAVQVVREQAVEAAPATAAKASVTLTHPDRLYWPEDGVTKEGLADYYEDVWPHIAPFVVARPLALLRCPDGVGKTCFFQKHAWRGINRNVKLVADPKNPQDEPFLVIDDRNGLISLVQAGVIEIHPWGSPLAALERPDSMIFDLDPGEDVAWPAVIAAAVEIRDRLQALGLAAFVKTSGGKGLHVNVPLLPKAEWDAVKDFAKRMANAMAADSPERYLAVATKAKRGGRIFVDYLRNGRGATAVAPFSTRARTGAAVSMPLAWEELSETIGPAYFTVHNAIARLAHQSDDPWRMFRKMERPLP